MKMPRRRSLAVSLGLSLGLGCAPRPQPPHGAGTEASASAATPWVRVTAPSDPALTELPALVVGDPSARSQVAVVYPSRIVAVHVRPGDRVAAGDAVIDVAVPELLRAHAAIAAAEARAEPQRRRAEQLRALARDGIVGAREVFEIDATLAGLEADRRLAAAVIAGWGAKIGAGRRGGLTLEAHSAGVVIAVSAIVGEVRDASSGPLLEIVGEGSGRVELRTPRPLPDGASFVFEGLDGRTIPLASSPEATLIDPVDGSTRAWLRPSPEVPLAHGMRGRVLVQTAQAGIVQVPERSMRWHDGAMVVVVRDGDGGRHVPVVVVGRSGSTALVRGELGVDDEVAADATAWVAAGEDAP